MPQGQLGAEGALRQHPRAGRLLSKDRAPVTQEIPDRPGISGLEVLVETKITAQLSEDTQAILLPVTQAANRATGTLQMKS